MTDFSKLTKAQRRVLGLIAMNVDDGHHPRTLEALLKRGLIEWREYELSGIVPVRVFCYFVPTHVHVAWCEWCSTQPDEEE